MSVRCSSWVWQHSRSKGNDRLVLLAIADIADDDGRAAHYRRSVPTLAEKTQLAESTVRERLRSLEQLGELVTEVGGGREASSYQVIMTPPDPGGVPASTPPDPGGHPTGQAGGTPPATGGHPTGPPVGHLSVLPRPSPNTPVDQPDSSPPATAVERIFDAWRTATGHERARLDAKRRRTIERALRDFPELDLVDAVRGWRHSPHHRGENATRTVYDGLHLLLRDAEHIERFRDLERGATPALSHGKPLPPARDLRRQTGEACPDCHDVGQVLDDHDIAHPCHCQLAGVR